VSKQECGFAKHETRHIKLSRLVFLPFRDSTLAVCNWAEAGCLAVGVSGAISDAENCAEAMAQRQHVGSAWQMPDDREKFPHALMEYLTGIGGHAAGPLSCGEYRFIMSTNGQQGR